MRSATAYSRAMPSSSRTSSTSRRDSTSSMAMLWMMDVKSFSASPNFPSVVVLYAAVQQGLW
jgi:membrane protein insertase Oxa1/YidC/SpoIIIJ